MKDASLSDWEQFYIQISLRILYHLSVVLLFWICLKTPSCLFPHLLGFRFCSCVCCVGLLTPSWTSLIVSSKALYLIKNSYFIKDGQKQFDTQFSQGGNVDIITVRRGLSVCNAVTEHYTEVLLARLVLMQVIGRTWTVLLFPLELILGFWEIFFASLIYQRMLQFAISAQT